MAGSADTITGFEATDSLQVGAVGAGATINHNDTLSASSFSGAVTAADTQIFTTHAAHKYAAVQVGADGIVFTDTDGDHHITAADAAVILTGKTLADIAAGNFV